MNKIEEVMEEYLNELQKMVLSDKFLSKQDVRDWLTSKLQEVYEQGKKEGVKMAIEMVDKQMVVSKEGDFNPEITGAVKGTLKYLKSYLTKLYEKI